MLIMNPNYKKADVVKAEKAAAKLTQFMGALSVDVESVTFDDIRAAVDAAGLAVTGEDLTDVLIIHIAQLGGFEVSE